jgi:hypothetical protein
MTINFNNTTDRQAREWTGANTTRPARGERPRTVRNLAAIHTNANRSFLVRVLDAIKG